MTRQEKRALSREKAKEVLGFGATEVTSKDQIKHLMGEINNLSNRIVYMSNNVRLIVDALERKNIISNTEIAEIEELYKTREDRKATKIKALLSSDKSCKDQVLEVMELPEVKLYERLDINPVKDLNLNPYEVAQVLMELTPDSTPEQLLEIGKTWSLTAEHFYIKTDEVKNETA